MIGAYWGRFNPPHLGHFNQIKKCLKKVDFLIIAIGSAEHKNEKRNPFDGVERKKMMVAYLKEEGIDLEKVKVIAIPDGKSMFSSVKNLFKYCGKFDILYTNKKTVIRLVGNKVKIREIKRIGKISGTKIRNTIASCGEWEDLTGKSVVKLIMKFKGIERIKKAYNKSA